MASLQFNNVNVSVNGSYILCESINVSESNPLKPIYNFNNSGPYDNAPTTVRGSISMNYYMETASEPNYSIINSIINNTTVTLPSIINVGEVYVTGYLNRYGFQLAPNGLVRVNCSFEVYYPFTGNLNQQNNNDSLLYDTTNSSGLGHYWSAQFYSGSNSILDNNILQLDYSTDVNLTPIYGIGSPVPRQIYVSNIVETLNILSEVQYKVGYTGRSWAADRPNLQNLYLSGIASNSSINISLASFLLNEEKYDVTTDNIILFSNTYVRSK